MNLIYVQLQLFYWHCTVQHIYTFLKVLSSTTKSLNIITNNYFSVFEYESEIMSLLLHKNGRLHTSGSGHVFRFGMDPKIVTVDMKHY